MNKLEILRLFKSNLVKFMTELSEQYDEPDFHVLRFYFSTEVPIEDAMEIFSERIIPHTSMIETEDDRFFYDCTDLFEGLQKDKVHYFRDMWKSPTFTADDRKVMWKWFKLFLKLAQKYKQ